MPPFPKHVQQNKEEQKNLEESTFGFKLKQKQKKREEFFVKLKQ